MSRHRKIKALDYDEECDDYYGLFEDEDEDFDEDAFETQYLSTGIDLNKSTNNSASKIDKSRQTSIDETDESSHGIASDSKSILICRTQNDSFNTETAEKLCHESCSEIINSSIVGTTEKSDIIVDLATSDLKKLAIQHLDKHQWQLPLMEMDRKFRDRTYYKHYTDSYISSLASKLGCFLADNQLITNPMKYHLRQEIDNYSKYSRMTELLTEYYQSLGSGFFSFSTPSPDEEIVIGCRLGTKAAKKTVPKYQQSTGNDGPKARFEYTGQASNKAQSNKAKDAQKTPQAKSSGLVRKDLTIQEDFTMEKIDELSRQCKEAINLDSKKATKNPNIFTSGQSNKAIAKQSKSKNATSTKPNQAQKSLTTLTEKRQNLKQLKSQATEPTTQEKETFKRQALQTLEEYNQLVKSSRPRVNLIVVGHVDAGKSTLVGHMLYNLGQISGKQMHRMEVDSQRSGKASFKYAWALDETDEERARGVTIDIALTQFETAHRDIVLLDAPGHVDFIPAVISGAAQAEAALLVVDATRGEFETGFTSGGQTREHTFLVRSLGVKSIIVVVNKMDNVDWSWNRFDDIVEQLKPFLKQVGFNLKEDVQFIACSGLTGDNLVERRVDKVLKNSSHPQLEGDGGSWSKMLCLLEAIDKIKLPERMIDKPVRLCVTDVFKGMSSGVFLNGKVISGKIENKQKLLLLPPNEACELKQVEVRGSKANRAFAGDIVTVVSTGVDLNKYYRGCILCDPVFPCQMTNRFQARVILFQSVNTVLVKGTPIEIHINGTYESGEVRRLISLLNKNTGELIQKKPRCLVKNSSAIIQLKLSRVVCCELYENNKDLGRFMMRSYGKTIAAGLITRIRRPKLDKIGSKMKTK